MDEAEDVVERAFVDRDARALGGGKDGHDFFEGGLDREDMEVGARNHDFADLKLTQLDGALNEFFFARGEQTALAHLSNEDLQLFGGVNERVGLRGADAHGADKHLRGVVEKHNRPTENAQEPTQGAGDEKRHALGALEAEAFGDKLAQDDVHEGEQQKGENHGDGVGNDDGPGAGHPAEATEKNLREGALADDAQGEAGDGDANLYAAEDTVEVAEKLLDNEGAGVALLDELLDASDADGNESELGGHEEGVEAGEEEDAEEAKEEHDGGILAAWEARRKERGALVGNIGWQVQLAEILRARYRKLLPGASG